MTNTQPSAAPPALSQPGLFAMLRRIGEEDLARHGKHILIGEAIEQWLQKIRRHAHVAVEQYDHIMCRCAKTCIGAAAKAEILRKSEHAYLRKCTSQIFGAAIIG